VYAQITEDATDVARSVGGKALQISTGTADHITIVIQTECAGPGKQAVALVAQHKEACPGHRQVKVTLGQFGVTVTELLADHVQRYAAAGQVASAAQDTGGIQITELHTR